MSEKGFRQNFDQIPDSGAVFTQDVANVRGLIIVRGGLSQIDRLVRENIPLLFAKCADML